MTELWGLTGGIACGKSTVSRMLARRGAAIIDADVLARRVVEPGTEGLADLVLRFGAHLLRADGTLDRAKLAERVFHDAGARADLNRITHPRIASLSQEKLATAVTHGCPVAVYDAALLVENGLHQGMREVLVVAATEATQLRRLQERDGLTPDAARARVASQLSLAEKRKVATVVFENDGALEALQAQVDAFWERVSPRFLAS